MLNSAFISANDGMVVLAVIDHPDFILTMKELKSGKDPPDHCKLIVFFKNQGSGDLDSEDTMYLMCPNKIDTA